MVMHLYRYLIVDTSGYHPFLAYVSSHEVLESWELPVGPDQGLVLDFLFKHVPLSFQGIAVAVGPGNFTATRTGISFAQGLALARKVPLLGYSSLEGYISAEDHGKALLLPLGKRGGVLSLNTDMEGSFFICKNDGVGPGMLLLYEEALAFCLEHGYYHIVSPNPRLFEGQFPDQIHIEELAPSIDCIRKNILSRFMFLNEPIITPDYRSCSVFF